MNMYYRNVRNSTVANIAPTPAAPQTYISPILMVYLHE